MAEQEEDWEPFVKTTRFEGAYEGYFFSTGDQGTGYYCEGYEGKHAYAQTNAQAASSSDQPATEPVAIDPAANKAAPDPFFRKGGAMATSADQAAVASGLPPAAESITKQLPPNCAWRVTRLSVRSGKCGLDMDPTEFGLRVDEVEGTPEQDLFAGDIIVGMDTKCFVGLSEDQMYASFKKRCVDGMSLVVCTVADLKAAKSLAPDEHGVIKGQDPQGNTYFFNVRTGKSAWTHAEAIERKTATDLAQFLTSGTSKTADDLTKKKRKKKKKAEEEKKKGPQNTDDDPFAETRARSHQWNKDGIGGYTAELHAKYQHFSKNKRPKLDVSLSP